MSTADVVRCAPQRRAALASAFRACEKITFNAETAEAAEKKCPRISQRALRALRSNFAFFHRLYVASGCSRTRRLGRNMPRLLFFLLSTVIASSNFGPQGRADAPVHAT